MKIWLRVKRGANAAGSVIDVPPTEAEEAIAAEEAWPLAIAEKMEAQANETKALKAAEKERLKVFAEGKINAAISKGVIPTQAAATQKIWMDRLTGPQSNDWANQLDELCALKGKDLTSRTEPVQTAEVQTDPAAVQARATDITVLTVDPVDALVGYSKAWTDGCACMERNSKLGGKDSDRLRRDAGRIAAKHLFAILDKADGDFAIRAEALKAKFGGDAVKAANAVGTLAGTLVLQRTLQLLRRKLLFLTKISTDFSAEGAKINQVINTRTRSIPTVVNYDPPVGQTDADGNAGAGTGWADSDANTTDVNVHILPPIGVQVTYDTLLLGSTVRNLFQEQVEPMVYALSVKMVKAWVSLFTAANFSHTADQPDPSGPAVAWGAVGVSIGAPGNFTAKNLVDVTNGLDAFLNPDFDRLVMLQPAYYNALLKDPALVAYLYAGSIQALTTGVLPELFGYMLQKSQALNDLTAPVVGMALTPSATLLASRLPQDYSQVFPDMPPTAIVEAVTEPETGLSLQMVRYVDHKLAETRARAAVCLGAAKGQKNAGILLTSN
jgi:hypothetical protein